MKKEGTRNITEEILQHILDITSGKCEITEDLIVKEENEDFQLILSGLLHLHEDFQFQLSELKNKEDVEKLNSQLKAKNKEMEQFAYIASHDLQEPVRTISNFATLLHTSYAEKLDENAKKSLSFMIEASNRMSALIKGLLDYSRIGRELRLTTVDCNELIYNIKQDLSSVIQETKTTIVSDDLPEIIANPTDFRLVFQNLINNSIKFRKKDVAPVISIGVKERPRSWEFSCNDNGIGIEKKHAKRIFQIFQRLHSRNEYSGTGIGLSHCQKIVELHGGKIWVESKSGEGSTFYFTIPN